MELAHNDKQLVITTLTTSPTADEGSLVQISEGQHS